MWHVILILFVIPIAVWILGSLFRAVEDQQKTAGQRPRMDGNARPQAQRPPRPANDIEGFLQEINRRRQASTRPAPQIQAGEAKPRPQLRATPPSGRKPTPSSTAMVPASVRKPQGARSTRSAEIVDVVVADVRPARTSAPQPVEEVVVVAEVVPTALEPAPPAPARAPTPLAPNLIALTQMLRTPGNIRTAMLLQEVLSPPMCLRQLHRARR